MMKELMHCKFIYYFKSAIYIQKKCRNVNVSKIAKVKILYNYWDKLLGQIQLRASKSKDKPIQEICRKLYLVKEDIKFQALKKYVTHCRWVYNIGFFQWRLNDKTTLVHNIENNNKDQDLLELIEKYTKIKSERACNNPKKLPESQLKIPNNFFKKYELEDEDFPIDYLINSFHKIELADPFPKEQQMMTNE